MSNLRLSGGMLVFLGALFWSLNSPLVKFISLAYAVSIGYGPF